MNQLSDSLGTMSETLFEISLARASDVVLSLNESEVGTPILEGRTGEPLLHRAQENAPALHLLGTLGNDLIEGDAASELVSQYTSLEAETVKGIGLGLEIAKLALAYYAITEAELLTKESDS